MPPKGRNKHPLGIWYIFGTERTRLIELLDFADFAGVNILKIYLTPSGIFDLLMYYIGEFFPMGHSPP